MNQPRQGYVVYEDTRRAAAGRRLDRTLDALRKAGIAAHGMVVDAEPVDAVRDALATIEPPATRSSCRRIPSGSRAGCGATWSSRCAGSPAGSPSSTSWSTSRQEAGEANVLVVANETLLGEPLLERIRERAATERRQLPGHRAPERPDRRDHADAERRLRRAITRLRSEGIDAHGQVAHPDPFTARAAGRPRRAGGRDHRLDVRAGEVSVAAPGPRPAAARSRPSCPSTTSSSPPDEAGGST